MIASADNPCPPLAAGLFGLVKQPAEPHNRAVPSDAARDFAQHLAESQGGEAPLDPPTRGR